MNVGNVSGFNTVTTLKVWVSHVLPLVYDDTLSFMELLGKVTYKLNELIENNNKLPDYIADLIREYISSGEIEKVLAEVLANYMLNVKFPPAGLTPATGDGSSDDTEAIQGCIDYAFNHGGMAVYFPSGSYLTQPLTLRDKATMFGQDRYTTRLVMKGGATKPLFTGTVDEMSLTGLGFDGNMDIQVNNVNLFTITVNSAIITNCLLTDGYDLLNITVNNELQLDNILFRHAVENALVVGGAGYVQGDNLIFKSLSTLIGKNYVVLNTNKSILEEVKCFGAAPNGVLIGGDNNVVNMWCEACQTPYVDNGTNNTIHVYGVLEDEKFTGNVTQYIGGFLNQTVVATKKLIARNVIDTAGETRQESTTGNKTETVNGNDTETVGGDKNETVSGSKSVIVTRNLDENIGTNKISVVKGTNTETITGLSTENANGGKVLVSTDYNENVTNKNLTASQVKETLTGNKTVKAANSTETIDGDKTVNAGEISNTAANITNHATQDLTEKVDGIRTLNVAGANNETTGAKTETVNGNSTESITGDREVSSQNYNETVKANKVTNANKSTENVTTEKDLNANVSRETLVTKTVNISGVNTENSGSKSETIVGDKVVKAANSVETIDGDKTVNAGNISNTAANITNHTTQDLTEQVDRIRNLNVTGANNETTGARTETVNGNSTENVTGDKNITSNILDINTVGNIKYKKDVVFDELFNCIPFNDRNGKAYSVLVGTEKTKNIIKMLSSNNHNFNNTIIIGDSFTAGDGLPSTDYAWSDVFCNIMNITNKKIYRYGGIGFITPSVYANNKALPDTLKDIIYPDTPNPNEITCIIVQGGLNDAIKTIEQEYTAVNNFLQYSKQYFPNAEVIGLTMLNHDLVDQRTKTGLNLAFEDNGFINTVNGNVWLGLRDDLMQSDNKHPNIDGAKFIANMFKRFIISGNDNVSYRKNLKGIHNEQMTIIVNGANVTFYANGTTPGGNVTRKILDFPSGFYYPNYVTFNAYADLSTPAFIYTVNQEVNLFTPQNNAQITWRFVATVDYPTYNIYEEN